MRFGEIASSAKYRMDKQIRICQFLVENQNRKQNCRISVSEIERILEIC